MNHTYDFRIIVIDDNADIHRDFIKILTNIQSTENLDKLGKKLFGSEAGNLFDANSISLPQFNIDTAIQGEEGVEKIREAIEKGSPYSLAFVDIRMPPGWDGIETIKHIWELDRDIQVVICTAYSDYSWEETVSALGKTDNLLILKKPFDQIAVRQLACALTRKWQLAHDLKKYTSSLEQSIKERTSSLEESLSLVRATLESSTDGILVVDNDGNIVDFNSKYIKTWNIPDNLVKEKKSNALTNHILEQLKNPDEYLRKISELRQKPDTITVDVIKCHDGRIFERYSQPHKLNNVTVGRVWSFHDITQRANLEKELEFQANHDTLTGLPNRLLLEERLRQAIASAQKNQTCFALLFFDLDRFKLVNDSLSHSIGDKLLEAVTTRLASCIRDKDTFARLGGDEFVIVITELANCDKIDDIVSKIQNQFTKTFMLAEHEMTISVSIGVSFYPKNASNHEELIRDADTAMYRAKELGGGQCQYYDEEMNKKTMNRLEKETALRKALTNEELYLCYQPQFNITGDKLIAVEALVRWNHPLNGIILPMDFIPLAEQTGLIVPIGEWILRTACKQAKEWQDEGMPRIRMAVNVTSQQLHQYNFLKTIQDVLNETGLSPEFLELELTENTIINNVDIVHLLNSLNEIGVKIALDDFGTGYSCLNYLRSIKLDRLKIDRSFVQNININRGDEVIIQAIIEMARSLNLEILAEGVENKAQLEFLQDQKCGEIQGFYFSRPLAKSEMKKLLAEMPDFKKMLASEHQ